jgi:ribonucleotide reductase alpha subunit
MFSEVEFFFILVIMAYLTPTVMRDHTSFCLLVMISGEFVVVNKHLLSDLTNMGLWTSELKNQVIYHNGSIQQIEGIPENLKKIYR